MKSAIALFFAATTAVGQIALGPDRFVCNPRFEGPSANAAAVATNGAETLVVLWTGASSSLYLQRLGLQGEPLTEHGVPLARGIRDLGGIASLGGSYVVLWTTDHTLWSLSIDASGNVSLPQIVGATATDHLVVWPHLASNGIDYVAAWGDMTGNDEQAMAVHLDSGGRPIGAPFALSERRNVAHVSALASDGRNYVAAVERLVDLEPKTTLVSVDAGTKADLSLFLRAFVHTASGFIGFFDDHGAAAVAVDASGHLGAPALLSDAQFLSAASNETDAMALVYNGTGIRVRRNGDAIETIDRTPITRGEVAATTHTGSYAAISLSPPASVTLLNGAAAAPRPLLSFPTAQNSPSIAGDGDLKVVAWREGTSVRAARIRGGVTLDPAGLDVSSGPQVIGAPALAMNAGRTLITWPETGQGSPNGPPPQQIFGRLLKPDGTLSAPFKIADSIQFITLGSMTATASGFAVLWSRGMMDDFFAEPYGGWRVTTVDAAGNVGQPTALAGPSWAGAAIVRRADGFLTVLRNVTVDIATDGVHFLEVSSKESITHDHQIWAQTLDANGTPIGTAHLLGAGQRAHVTWNGSTFVVVSEASLALVAADGSVLTPLTPLLAADSAQSVIAGDTIATRHSAIDTGVGDTNVVFVRSFTPTPPRHRAARR
jgi:hypothetical protein